VLNEPTRRNRWELRHVVPSDAADDYHERYVEMCRRVKDGLLAGTWPVCKYVEARAKIEVLTLTENTLRAHMPRVVVALRPETPFAEKVHARTAFLEDAFRYAFSEDANFKPYRAKFQVLVLEQMRLRSKLALEAGEWPLGFDNKPHDDDEELYRLCKMVDAWALTRLRKYKQEYLAGAGAGGEQSK
jgi:hypothetical protein